VGARRAPVRLHRAATRTRRTRRHLVFVDDLDALVTRIAERGLVPAERETYASGVRKVTYRDPDGNEFGYGGAVR